MIFVGYRDVFIYKELKRIILIVVVFGGVIFGLLSVVVDMMGVLGSGIGILMVIIIIYGCEIWFFLLFIFLFLLVCWWSVFYVDFELGIKENFGIDVIGFGDFCEYFCLFFFLDWIYFIYSFLNYLFLILILVFLDFLFLEIMFFIFWV